MSEMEQFLFLQNARQRALLEDILHTIKVGGSFYQDVRRKVMAELLRAEPWNASLG